jgi:uncharacterized protein with NRDE domain
MCLVTLAWNVSHHYPLVIAANRDEFYVRPTLPAQEWDNAPGVYGGRDLRAGGGWLALSQDGRLAAVTNVREPLPHSSARSRGHLIRDFMLNGGHAADEAALRLADAKDYGPFNLLLWDGRDVIHVTNRPVPGWVALEPGLHGLSNGALDSDWPKVRRVQSTLKSWLATLPDASCEPDVEADVAPLFAALSDADTAQDAELPNTGLDLEMERQLSPPFICGDEYGTRASTVVLVRRDGRTILIERRFGAGGVPDGESRVALPMSFKLSRR